ncbi:MAG: hypothetical protein MJ181_10525 [Treponema sp.]|nr:hypothetical protein [Treponema sp.]
MICWNCGNVFEGEVHRTTECPSCKKDLHSCYNCRFFSEGSHYDCSESSADLVSDKERANFCDYFKEGNNSKHKSSGSASKNDPKAAFDALFG